MKELVGLVLAGGIGKRFWPLKTNKLFFDFLGRKFIQHSVFDCIPDEITKLVIIVNNENKHLFETLKIKQDYTLIVQPEARGMADAVIAAKEELKDKSVMVILADHLVDADLYKSVIGLSKKNQAFGILPGWKTEEYFPGGYLDIDNNYRIKAIIEKPLPANRPSNYVDVSGQYIRDANIFLDEITKVQSDKDDIYEIALSNIAKKHDFYMLPYQGTSLYLKHSWDILTVTSAFLKRITSSKISKNAVIKPNVVIDGPVIVSDGVVINENSKIVGPVYIGPNTIIGNNNLIRESHLGSGCVTGNATEITRSYISDKCWFHNNYIGDSILDTDVSFGAKTVTANLRLDEGHIYSIVNNEPKDTGLTRLGVTVGSHVRFGVGCNLMPGKKIGSGSFISAGVNLDRDIEENSFCTAVSQLHISKNRTSIDSSLRDTRRVTFK